MSDSSMPARIRLGQLTDDILALDRQGAHDQARTLAAEAVDLAYRQLGENSSEHAQQLVNLGVLTLRTGNRADAATILDRAISILTTIDDRLLPSALLSRARLSEEMGASDDALRGFQTALEAAAYGGDDATAIQAGHSLASLLRRSGAAARAGQVARDNVGRSRRLYGETSPLYADALHDLAAVRYDLADYTEAGTLAAEILDIRQRALGEVHSSVADILTDLARVNERTGQEHQNIELFKRIIAIREQLPGQVRLAAAARSDLAEAYAAIGAWPDARREAQDAVTALRRVIGENEPEIADRLATVARVAGAADDETGEEAALREIAARRAQTAPGGPAHAIALNNLADLLYRQRRYDDAEPLYRQALAITERTLPRDEPALTAVRHNLANLLAVTGLADNALALHELVLSAHRIHPVDADALATSLLDVSRLDLETGRLAAAEEAATELLAMLASTDPRKAEAASIVEEARRRAGDTEGADRIRSDAVGADAAQRSVADSEVRRLEASAAESHRAGDWELAARLHEEALRIGTGLWGPDDLTIAAITTNLAFAYNNLGRYGEAERLARRSLAVRLAALGADDAAVASAGHMLARVLQATGRYQEASNCLAEALAVHDRLGTRKTVEAGTVLSSLALTEQSLWQLTNAEGHAREAADIARTIRGENSVEYALTLGNLASLLQGSGRAAQGAELARAALRAATAALGSDHPDLSPHLLRLARALRVLGDEAEAEGLTLRALDLGVVAHRPRNASAAARELGRLALGQGRLRQAHNYFEQAAERLRDSAGGSADLAWLLLDEAEMSRNLGDLSTAEARIRQALELLRQLVGTAHPDYGRALYRLGGTLLARSRTVEGEQALREAHETLQATLGAASPEATAPLAAIAELYLSIGAERTAQAMIDEALSSIRAAYGDSHPDVAKLVALRGRAQALSGDVDAAERSYRDALSKIGPRSQGRRRVTRDLATLLAATRRGVEAIELLDDVVADENEELDDVLALASERHRRQYLTSLKRSTDSYLTLVLDQFRDDAEDCRRAFELVLRRKALGTKTTAGQRQMVLVGRYPHLADALRELEDLRARLGRGLFSPQLEDDESQHALTRRREELERLLAAQIPEMSAERRDRSVDAHTVAATLQAGSWLVEFVRANRVDFSFLALRKPSIPQPPLAYIDPAQEAVPARYAAFLLPAGHAEALELLDLGPADRVESLIEAFRIEVTKPIVGNQARQPLSPEADPGNELRQVVLDPIRSRAPHATSLVVAPDGALSLVPLEALPTGSGRVLLDDCLVSYVTTGRDTLRFGERNSPRSSAVVFADPDFDLGAPGERAAESQRLPRLPGTRLEGEAVARLLGAPVITGSQASVEAVRAVRGPALLHIATHGLFLPLAPQEYRSDVFDELELIDVPGEGVFVAGGRRHPAVSSFDTAAPPGPVEEANSPTRSALALAGANTSLSGGATPTWAGDGLLTADDVAGLDLRGTRLVVLSACDSGLGSVEHGEGVLGLRSGVVVSGAQTLVMSLWKVPDWQTELLMTDYYARLLRGCGRADALRQARMFVRERYPHPYYWAAFICQGDPAALTVPTESG